MICLAAMCARLRVPEPAVRAAWHAVLRSRVAYIPKRSGRSRRIVIPPPEAARVLRKLAKQFTAVLPVHASATAFRPGLSVYAGACRHAGCGVLVHMDLRDFFERIRRSQVRVALQASYGLDAVDLLADLTTYGLDGLRVLPQGFPTSPPLSNAVLCLLDEQLAGLGWTYTRYADDLHFSRPEGGDPALLQQQVREAVQAFFGPDAIADEKSTVTWAAKRACHVLGYVVSPGGVRVPRPLWQRLKTLTRAVLEGDRTVRSEAYGLAQFLALAEPERAAPYLNTLNDRKLS